MGQFLGRAGAGILFLCSVPVVVALVALVSLRTATADVTGAAPVASSTPQVVYTPLPPIGGPASIPLSDPEGIALDSTGNVFVVDAGNNRVLKFSSLGVYLSQWQAPVTSLALSPSLLSVGVDGKGSVYVSDVADNVIDKFVLSSTNPDVYTQVSQWSTGGTSGGELTGIAVDSAGDVFVLDQLTRSVSKFSPSITDPNDYTCSSCLTQWNVPNLSDTSVTADGIALDTQGDVYVIDQNYGIDEFSPSTGYSLSNSLCIVCGGASYLQNPIYIAVDPNGNVFIDNNDPDDAIQKLSPFALGSVAISTTFNLLPPNQAFTQPGGITVDPSGNLYVTDTVNDLIYKLSPAASDPNNYTCPTCVLTWGFSPVAEPQGVALDPAGGLDVVDPSNVRIDRFDPATGRLELWWGEGHPDGCAGNGRFNNPVGVTAGVTGTTYVSDSIGGQIEAFDESGQFTFQWGGSCGAAAASVISVPWGLAANAAGDVYLADFGNNQIQEYDAVGNSMTAWSSWVVPAAAAPVSANRPAVARTPTPKATPRARVTPRAPAPLPRVARRTRTASTVTARAGGPPGLLTPTVVPSTSLQRLDGGMAGPPCSFPVGAYQFDRPVGVAVGPSGDVYVTEYGNNRVDKFDPNGNFLTQWGCQGSGPGQFFNPDGIAVDASENVYVADFGGNRVEKFDANGTFLTQWGCPNPSPNAQSCPGESDNGPGTLAHPSGIAVDAAGLVYVGDQNHNQIDVFAPVVLPTMTATVTVSPTASPSPTATLTATPPPGGTVVVVTQVASATVSVAIPAELTPVATLVVGAPTTTPTIAPSNAAFQFVLAIEVQATGPDGTSLTTLSAPVTISIQFTAPDGLNGYLTEIDTIVPNGKSQRLATSVTRNADGSFTATAQTNHFSNFVVFAPGIGTPVPLVYEPSVQNSP